MMENVRKKENVTAKIYIIFLEIYQTEILQKNRSRYIYFHP